MYAQVEKPKENKSRAVANSVAQNKSNGKQGFGFVDNRPEVIAQQKSITKQYDNKYMSPNSSISAKQLKIVNNIKAPNKEKIDNELCKIKKNVYGEAIWKNLDERKKVISIIDCDINNASDSEVRINVTGNNLDSTILHEMTHVVHANVDDTQFDLNGIYKNLMKLYYDMSNTKSTKENRPLANDELASYFSNQEEELVTSEWESRYGRSENSKNERAIRIREHYMDDGQEHTKGKTTGDLQEGVAKEYAAVYKVDQPSALQMLKSYDAFLNLLQSWLRWLNTYSDSQYFASTLKDWKKEQITDSASEIKGKIEVKIRNLNTMKKIMPSD